MEPLPPKSTHTTDQPIDHPSDAKLGWILLNKQWLSSTQLESALAIHFQCQKKLGELLVEQQLISTEQLEQALREQYWRRNGYWII